MTSLLHFPSDILLSILLKANPRGLCRLRQTCKIFESLAQKYKSRFTFEPIDEQWILYFHYSGYKQLRTYVLRGTLEWDSLQTLPSLTHGGFYHPMGPIQDPIRQLSGINFNTVILKSSVCEPEEDFPHHFWSGEVLSLLRQMNLKCERLCLAICDSWKYLQIFLLIEFRSLVVRQVFYEFPQYEGWPIHNCIQHDIAGVSIYPREARPQRISPYTRNMKKAKITLEYDSYYTIFVVLDFLKDIREDRSARGIIESLSIGGGKQDDSSYEWLREHAPGLQRIFEGAVFDYSRRTHKGFDEYLRIFRLDLDGEVAIIVQLYLDYNIFFLPEVNRQILFDLIFPFMFARVPFDTSVIYDKFMAVPSDARAFRKLFSTYKRIYEAWEEEEEERLEKEGKERSNGNKRGRNSEDENFVVNIW